MTKHLSRGALAPIALGGALRLAFALLPLRLLLVLLEDDAWMVTAIARHWALGHGTTADGLTPTNGFHPLYPLTLGALPYMVQPNNLDFGFRASMIICAILATLALVPLYLLARKLADERIALGVLAIASLNPLLIRVTVNAMESAMSLLLLLVLWWYWAARRPETLCGAAMLGLLAALAILARLDVMLAAAMLGLALLISELRGRRFPRLSLTYGATTLLLLAPYFVRNLIVFNALTPSSGRALSYLHSFKESFVFTSGLQLVAYQPAFDFGWAPAWLLALLMLGLAALAFTLPRPQLGQLAPLLLYAAGATFYYSYIQQNGHQRYYTGVAMVILLLLAVWTKTRAAGGARVLVPALATGGVLLNSLFFMNYVDDQLKAPSLAQPAMYDAARWIAANLPPEAQLGAQNSGIYQYYSQRPVLNFDGKLNHEIIPVLERRELAEYLRAKGVDYIVDLPEVSNYLEYYSSSLSEAPSHKELSSTDKLLIYGRMILAKLGLGEPVQLDVRIPTRVTTPFTSTAEIVQTWPLPNNPERSVTLYRLTERFGR